MTSALSENIKKVRLSAKMNQVEFAKQLNVTKQCISNWENDNVVPSIEMLVKIADMFNVSTDYLLGRTDKQYVDVSELTVEQIGHILLIIKDLSALNNKN